MNNFFKEDTISSSVCMQSLSAFGSLIQFDNAFDITRNCYENLSTKLPFLFVKGNFYEIDKEQYYYPGYYNAFNYFNNEQGMKILLKL